MAEPCLARRSLPASLPPPRAGTSLALGWLACASLPSQLPPPGAGPRLALGWWAHSTLFSQLPPPGAGPCLAFQGQRARLPLCPLHLTNLPVPHLNAHLPTDRQMRRRTSWMGVDGAPRAGCDKLAWRHAANAIKTTRCKMQPIECICGPHGGRYTYVSKLAQCEYCMLPQHTNVA